MPSLSEAYERRRGGDDARRRRLAGAAIFTLGVCGVLAAVVLASTDAGAAVGWGLLEARRIAGVLGGIGAPALLVGVVVALPAAARQRALVGAGSAVCLAGVALFWYAYPDRWFGVTPDHLTFEVAAIYAVGVLVALWYVLSAVATFRARNDPQGTVTVEVIRGGETTVVEVEGDVDRARLRDIADRQG